jgi:23S rRNA pseudouridine1911/1915/1917 synthase
MASPPLPISEIQLTVQDGEGGLRLDRWLAVRHPELSRTRLKQLIEQSQVRVDDAVCAEPAHLMTTGQVVILRIPATVDIGLKAQDLDLDVVFEDAHLIIINKPAGLVVHPAAGNPDGTLVNALLAHCGDSLRGIGGEHRPGIVHRLDKDTSGLLVAAKSEKAHTGLAEQFAAHTIARAYDALVWGVPRQKSGVVAGQISRSTSNRKKMTVSKFGKYAETHYEVITAFGEVASLVRCTLKTGRTHQIRVHMTSLGHPLVGDQTYGAIPSKILRGLDDKSAEALRTFPRQALHARLLGFKHPITGRKVKFERDAPKDMKTLLSSLKKLNTPKRASRASR